MPLYALGVQGFTFSHGNCVPVGGNAQWFLTGVGITVPDDTLAFLAPHQNELYKSLSMVNPTQLITNNMQISVGLVTGSGQTSIVNYGDLIGYLTFLKKA